MKKSDKKQSGRASLRMITILLTVTFAVVWAAGAVCLTYAFAVMLMERETENAGDYDWNLCNAVSNEGHSLDGLFADPASGDFRLQDTIPSVLEIASVHAVASNMISGDSAAETTLGNSWDELYSDTAPMLADADVPVTTGAVIRDADGNIIAQSGDVMEAEEWYSQEEWEQGCQSDSKVETSCWIDLADSELQTKMKSLYDLRKKGMNLDPSLCPAVKITGVLEGRKLVPKAVWYITDESLRGISPSDYNAEDWWNAEALSALEADAGISWTAMFDDTSEGDSELVTYYAVNPILYTYDASPITYRNHKYDNALTLVLQTTVPEQGERSNSIWQVSYRYKYQYYPAENYIDESTDITAASDNPELTVDYIYIAYPVRGAVRILRHIYLATFLLTALIVLFLRRKIYRSCVLPMEALNRSMREQQGED